MRRLILAAILSMATVFPASADIRILSSSGGEVTEYLRLFALLRQSGERIVIDGPCFSACTLVLTTIPTSRICVTRKAVLGFHAARVERPEEVGPAWDAALAAGRPALIEAITDPEVPPLPPHIRFEQASGMAKALMARDPAAKEMVTQSLKGKLAEFMNR